MRTFILLAGLGEVLVGLEFLFAPGLITEIASNDVAGTTFTRMYGAAALAVGVLSLIVWKRLESNWVKPFFAVFSIFHAGVTLACYKGYTEGGEGFLPVCGLHAILLVISLLFYFRE